MIEEWEYTRVAAAKGAIPAGSDPSDGWCGARQGKGLGIGRV